MDRLISYASEQNPVVHLVNQDVLTDAKKYREKSMVKHKSELENNTIELYDYYLISEKSGGYIHWLNSKPLPPPKSMTATVCDALTPGCLSRRSRVHAESGGSKKRAKKTRKQRKHRNLKRNHKK